MCPLLTCTGARRTKPAATKRKHPSGRGQASDHPGAVALAVGMAGGAPAGPPVGVVGGPAAAAVPGVPTSLVFEFWNDRRFQHYGAEEQRLLSTRLQEQPRPKEVLLPSGKYKLLHFDDLEAGLATQLNCSTNFERPVRLKPPYTLPGANAAQLPLGAFHFEFQDDHRWKSYSPALQQELQQVVRCIPPPAQFFFAEEGKLYLLFGLRDLSDLFQMNVRTSHTRQVRLAPGPAPVPGAGGAGVGAGSLGHAAGTNGFFRGRAVGRGAAAMAAAAAAFGAAGASVSSSSSVTPFSLRSAVSFAVVQSRSRSRGSALLDRQELAPDAREVLLAAWLCEPRPERVTLPSGDVVENLGELELGGAGVCQGGAAGAARPLRHSHRASLMPVLPELPLPAPGAVVLPAELDLDTTFSMASCGRCLSGAEIAALPSRGPEANKCSICLMEMVDDDASNGSNALMANPQMTNAAPMDPSDNSLGDVAMGTGASSVFELHCGHVYHTDCLKQWFDSRRRCPQCQKDFGKVVGEQPRAGTLHWHLEHFPLPGHEKTSTDTIIIHFDFPAGTSETGTRYEGRKPKGYLPGNVQGIVLLELFKIAFRRCVMFGLGTSMTFGTYRPTFNIHIKTSTHRGTAGHGYPDDSYFRRALDELRTNGVTIADLAS